MINMGVAALVMGVTLAECDYEDWHHLMTVNPSDGQKSWHYTSDLWYEGDKGNPENDRDYISDRIRHIPV